MLLWVCHDARSSKLHRASSWLTLCRLKDPAVVADKIVGGLQHEHNHHLIYQRYDNHMVGLRLQRLWDVEAMLHT